MKKWIWAILLLSGLAQAEPNIFLRDEDYHPPKPAPTSVSLDRDFEIFPYYLSVSGNLNQNSYRLDSGGLDLNYQRTWPWPKTDRALVLEGGFRYQEYFNGQNLSDETPSDQVFFLPRLLVGVQQKVSDSLKFQLLLGGVTESFVNGNQLSYGAAPDAQLNISMKFLADDSRVFYFTINNDYILGSSEHGEDIGFQIHELGVKLTTQTTYQPYIYGLAGFYHQLGTKSTHTQGMVVGPILGLNF